MSPDSPSRSWPLLAARACAWSLLMAGWIGIGAQALALAPTTFAGFALVAAWLIALGAAAALPRPLAMAARHRAPALLVTAAVAGAAMWTAPRGGGIEALVVALIAWALLTALASGVVRALRLQQATMPRPPVTAAAAGALAAGLVLGDPGDLLGLSLRLSVFAIAVAGALAALQRWAADTAAHPGCRAGLFDCSLPAWPQGAWRDALQWPTLLASLAMLPMMAGLPLMASWCRDSGVDGQEMVLLHLAAMFVPAWLFNPTLARWSLAQLSLICAALMAAGAACVAWAPAPWGWLGLAITHGTAWGLAWGGLLWAPARRGAAGRSPLRAALGYALLTVAFGAVVESAGARGAAAAQMALGATAAAGWLVASLRRIWPSVA